MYQKKKKKVWIWVVLILVIALAAGGFFYYRQVQAADEDAAQEEIVLEDGQEWKYLEITQILGNEMTGTILEEDGTETSQSVTWMIPVGTDVVTKLGTTTTFARLASGDTLKVLMQGDDILKIWITDLTQDTQGDMPQGDGEMPDMGEMSTGDMPDRGNMPDGGGDMPSFDADNMPSMDNSGMPGGGN